MAHPIWQTDCYLRTCESTVVSVESGKFIELGQSVFSPRGGGLPSDTGKLTRNGEEFAVLGVTKKDGKALHEISREGLAVGDKVICDIDWQRRHRLMRMHTAGHILSAIMFKKGGILITGNSIDVEKSRFDFSMENFDRAAFQALIDDANLQIARNLDVSISFLPREEALRVEGMVKLAGALPPDVLELRIVAIGDVDRQADGGVHVKNTSEVGRIVLLSAENKGKSNRRVYFALEP
jgi:Ser-tRNA(Ala) deacylase AlaX